MECTAQQVREEDMAKPAPTATGASAEVDQLAKFERFLEGVSEFAHGLRNSLTVIRGSSELLMESGKDEAKIFAEMVHDESTHLARLSQDLLDLSRLERKKFNLTPRWIDLPYLIHRASAQASGIAGDRNIEVLIQESIPPVFADPNSIEQVTLNLLNNAIERSSENGTVRIVVSAEAETGNRIHVAIHDEGAALSPEDSVRIFEPFAVRYPTASHGKRTWLGLAISKAIIESQGGSIAAHSANGAGAQFTFSLPAATWAPEDSQVEE